MDGADERLPGGTMLRTARRSNMLATTSSRSAGTYMLAAARPAHQLRA
jgi:hypothetical protein